ncbi:MAG TPA: hypothetical protein DCZ91_07565 [Lachnospiraceae bacterium]|nr:hypothetical protein [Lachnospiraceae bacterium]
MRMKSKYLVMAGIVGIMLAVLTGCGNGAEDSGNDREEIELHEPKGTAVNTEPVRRRNLYNATVYEGAVYPYVEEYSFPVVQRFGSYGALIGDTVQKGDILVNADEEAALEKLKDLEEKLRETEEEYTEFKTKKEEELYIQNLELERLKGIVENLEEDMPEETVTDKDGKQIPNPDYAAWQSEYVRWEGERSLKDYDIQVNEEALRQHKELYQLDYEYYNSQIQELRAQRKDARVVSQISGVVVNMGYYIKGQMLARGEAVAAVADMERKYIKCGSIARRLLVNAADLYVFVNGKRYEIQYEGSDRRSTTFTFSDEENELEVGDYAVVVLKTDYREDVLTVPSDSVYQEGTAQVVYVLEEGQSIARTVETGMDDGMYVEILSGLSEGELVVSQGRRAGTEEAVLERKTRQRAYTGTGYAIMPVTTVVSNPVENGVVVSEGNLLRTNNHVSKGEALMSVRVEADELDIASRETALKRAEERLADLEAEGREEDEEDIAKRRKSIEEQEKELAEIRRDAGVTEICSPVDGFLQYLPIETGQTMEKGAMAALVADEGFACLMVDISENRTLNYGDELTISYKDHNNADQVTQCRVLTLGACGQDCYMGSDVALMSVPEEVLDELPLTDGNVYGNQIRLYRPTGYVNRMENVILVPAEAVTVQSGRTYVDVMGEDGNVMPTAFLAGGSDRDYYWVVEGLTEGMKICWE